MHKVKAIIMAGDSQIFEGNDKGNKALIDIKGKMMIEYIISALRDSELIDEITLIGTDHDEFERVKPSVDHFILASGSGVDNGMKGLDFYSEEEHSLIITSDVPLITGQAIDGFLRKAIEADADFGYPVIPKEICMAAYPDAKRTYIKTAQGTFTGGNIFYMRPAVRYKVKGLFEKFNDQRKNPIRLGFTLGFRVLFGVLFKNIKIETAEKRVKKLTGINAKALICEYPEIGNDVDKPEDVEMIGKYVKFKAES